MRDSRQPVNREQGKTENNVGSVTRQRLAKTQQTEKI
jgi:hypothetical protein